MSRDGENRAQILHDHNHYRAIHGAQPLRFHDELNTSAQDYAEELAWRDATAMPKSRGNYGESIYACSSRYSAATATPSWYSEISSYNFGIAGFSYATDHFTALVWRNTTYLGVGIAHSRSGRTFVVAHYFPPGNQPGQFEANVKASKRQLR